MVFETKLAAAGDILEKLAAEQGLNVRDFTENEITDLLTTIMGGRYLQGRFGRAAVRRTGAAVF